MAISFGTGRMATGGSNLGNAATAGSFSPRKQLMAAAPAVRQPHVAARLGSNASAQTVFSTSDIELVCALASMQVKYGKPQEAFAYLAALRRFHPENRQVSRLLVVVLMRLNRWAEADELLCELEVRDQHKGAIHLMYRSLIEFRNNRLAQARHWFNQYVLRRAQDMDRG
jgi:predicted Zn-dependent protease